jgi:hypothetical protein
LPALAVALGTEAEVGPEPQRSRNGVLGRVEEADLALGCFCVYVLVLVK